MPGIIQKLGSFPNSQVKPTPATRTAEIIELTAPALPASIQYTTPQDLTAAIVVNNGPNPLRYAYEAGDVATGPIIAVGGAVTIDDAEATVFLSGVGGTTEVRIDEREG